MHILLISTYELGHQPIHLAAPSASLRAAGHEVSSLDVSVEDISTENLVGVDAVAFSVPMHTAMRLAIPLAAGLKAARSELPIAFYGLYADVGRDRTLGVVADAIFCGEYEPALVEWADKHEGFGGTVLINLDKSNFLLPDRAGLPGLENYARLEHGGRAVLAGAVEASHGCRHRCRHCPIPAVYDGRLRIVGNDVVLGDIDQLVAAGAEHVTFADADFLNAPAYSMGLLRSSRARHPSISYDVTVKVEHIIEHRDLWPEMAELGVLFVVSAFESVDDETLQILDKGHTVADMAAATSILRESRISLRPTWLPFLPWTTPSDVADIFRFLDQHDLAPSVDPVQFAIRVLIPEGSLLIDLPEMKTHLTHFDPEALTWGWEFVDADAERLHKELDRIAASASDCQEESEITMAEMRRVVSDISGVNLGAPPVFAAKAPRLSESWFCCAEPTAGQATAIKVMAIGSKPS